MKTGSKLLPLLAVSFLTLVSSVSAQIVTQTYETQTGYLGSVSTFGATGSSQTRGEIFTDVSAVKALTYNFFAGSANGNTSAATTLSATFGEWNTSNNTFVGGTTVSFGTITVPASGTAGWVSTLSITGDTYANYSYTFDFTTLSGALIDANYGYLTNASKSYALMLTNTTGIVTNLGLGLSNSDTFAYGYAKGASDYDYVFSQIVVVPGNQPLSPVPEASTMVSLAALVLVAGLIFLRLRQRRAAALVPVPVS